MPGHRDIGTGEPDRSYDRSVSDSGRPPVLSDPERRRLLTWRAVVRGSIAMVWLALAAEIALLVWPRAPRGAKIAAGAVLVESFLTAVLIGALGKCPRCGSGFGLGATRLMPERCASCGVPLE